MPAVICVGAQWGDEGKGKIVDLLATKADIIVRFQGGNNAGHTLIVNGEKTVLHLVPSGILHKDKMCVISNGVVIDPGILVDEIEGLKAKGLEIGPEQLMISHQAHVILDLHRIIDRAREKYLPQKIGTTGRGIGPTYEDKTARRGLRILDMLKTDSWGDLVRERVAKGNIYLAGLGAPSLSDADVELIIMQTRNHIEKLKPYVRDTVAFLNKAVKAEKLILFEGAQGTLLDIDHGTYPYVTSSNTVAGAACAGSGIGPTKITSVLGVTKAYATRVGEGPFPTELKDSVGDILRENGSEYGATTGRPRRCGWLDLVALRRAVDVNGIDTLAVTKLDILRNMPTLKVAVAYNIDGKIVEEYPADTEELARAIPVYKEYPGFTQDVKSARVMDDLPVQARQYVDMISKELNTKIRIVGVGAERDEIVKAV